MTSQQLKRGKEIESEISVIDFNIEHLEKSDTPEKFNICLGFVSSHLYFEFRDSCINDLGNKKKVLVKELECL